VNFEPQKMRLLFLFYRAAKFFKKAVAQEFTTAIFPAPFLRAEGTAKPAEPITDPQPGGRNDGSALQVADLVWKRIELCL
jgi:hypothetical protein